MNSYVLVDELRSYLRTLQNTVSETEAAVSVAPIEDIEDASSVYESFVYSEGERMALEEVDSWVMGNAVRGHLIAH